jgi:hypothetical protein
MGAHDLTKAIVRIYLLINGQNAVTKRFTNPFENTIATLDRF